MKLKVLVCVAVILASIVAKAQKNRAVTFDVNGLKVILRTTPKETVSVAMFYKGGVMNYLPEQTGIEILTLSSVATCGTKNFTVEDYNELADEYGIDISGISTTDYGVIRMNCIRKYFDQGWKLFADAIINPTFDQNEFENQRGLCISSAMAKESNPESLVKQITMMSLYANTNYATMPWGSESSLKSFTADIAKTYYYNTLLNKKKMFLVVAGKIEKEDLQKKIEEALSNLPEKEYVMPTYQEPSLKGDRFVAVQHNLPSNYISRVMNAPRINSPDFPAFQLSINILSSYTFFKLRTQNALAYAPGARVTSLQMPFVSMYTSSTNTREAVLNMAEAYSFIKSGNYNPEVLSDIKKNYKNSIYRSQETAQELVKDLGEAEVLGSYKFEEELADNVAKATLTDVNNAFKKYMQGALWVILGDKKAAEEVFTK